MGKAQVLILSGYGVNCEVETGWAFEKAGADRVTITHINRAIAGEVSLDDFQVLVFPGGFSFGDHIASGRVLGVKVKQELGPRLTEFVRSGRLVLGICNGFQVLVKTGLLPGDDEQVFAPQKVTLAHNDSARYEDRWVTLKANPKSRSPFLRDVGTISCAVRHGEGKFLALDNEMARMKAHNMIAFQYVDKKGVPTQEYPKNPNGSEQAIAGITNKRGNILGLMPHPEVFISKTQHPHWTRLPDLDEQGAGLKIFRNAVEYVKNEL